MPPPSSHAIGRIVLTAALVCSTGCAGEFRQRYAAAPVSLSATGTKTIAVATHDRRSRVVEGEEAADQTGYDRALWGGRRPVYVEEGLTLADAVTHAVCMALEARGYRPVPVRVSATDTPEAVREQLRVAGADRAVVVAINDWESSTWFGTDLDYDLTLAVLNRWSDPLETAHLGGNQSLGLALWDPAAHAEAAVPPAVGGILGRLLSQTTLAPLLQ
ncbi:MAG: hypothetical protein KC466_08215 [Myxococcales bacterium]|nr:hypothetical protein [Myxococcales bacterium]